MTLLAREAQAGPLLVGFARMAVAAPCLLLAARFRERSWRLSGRRDALGILATGACMSAYQVFYFSAVPLTGVAVTALLAICSSPLMIAGLAALFLGERLTPKVYAALAMGVVGTGLLPEVVADSLQQIRRGAQEAGRDVAAIDVWWWVMCNVSEDRDRALWETRSGLAAAGNHLARFTTQGKHIPGHLLERIRELRRRYIVDYHFTAGADNKNAALVDELGLQEYLADRFAIAGTPKDCLAKIEKLAALGVTQIWSSPSFHDKLAFLRGWGKDVMPHVR